MKKKNNSNLDADVVAMDTLMKAFLRMADCLLATHPNTPRIATAPVMINAATDEIEKLRSALESMCYQFGAWHEGVGGIGTGGLSDLEEAFAVLGWDDPHPVPSMCCDEPGCTKQATCGRHYHTGYRRTCVRHMTCER